MGYTPFDNKPTDESANPFVQNQLNRYHGGISATRDPLVSGFFIFHFFKLPAFVEQKYGQVLTSITKAVTMPTMNIENIAIDALGGLKFQVPGALTYGDTLTVTFTEYNKLIAYSILSMWFLAIRDQIGGFANVEQLVGDGKYVGKNYGGEAILIILRPDMKDIEGAFVCEKIWPKKLPLDEVGSVDISAVEKKDLTVDFSVDLIRLPNEKWVMDEARTIVDQIRTDSTVQYLYNRGKVTEGGQQAP